MNDNFCAVPADQQSIESTQVAKVNPGVNGKWCMDNLALEAEIQKLVAEGRGSLLKQRLAINTLSKLLDKHRHFLAGRLAGSPCLEKAWPDTLSHCLVNFWAVPADDKRTGSAYCDSPNIVYRIRKYFKHRIVDEEMKQRGATRNEEPLPLPLDASIGEDDDRTIGEMVAAPEQDQNHIWLRELINEDVTGELAAMTMKSQPALSAQKAFQMCLDGYTDVDIAKHFGVKTGTFTSFFRGDKRGRNCCTALLRRLWDEQEQ
jgi:hypothetical protein